MIFNISYRKFYNKYNMVLETSECIPIQNDNITYTDCMEFSLLRFMQLLLYDAKQMSKEGFSHYPKDMGRLQEFVRKYNKIYKESGYYLGDAGKEEREEWACFLSRLDFMIYYRNDDCELFTCLENIYRFCNAFLGMKLVIDNEDQNLQLIAQKFSNRNKNIILLVKERRIGKKEMKMKEIMDLLLRPDCEYFKQMEKRHFVTNTKTVIYICINNVHKYEWTITETYFDGQCEYANRYITGHSVIVRI